MKKYFEIDDEGKKLFIEQTALRTGLPKTVVEKDLWVTATLQVVFQLPFSDKLVFKGGSSLSKVWSLINRMSEDIDLAYGSNFGLFEGDDPTIRQVKKLRKQSSLFVKDVFCNELSKSMERYGLSSWCTVMPQENGTGNSTYPEPRQIYIYYKSLFPEEFENLTSAYVKPMVMLEVSSRSLMEPSATSKVRTLISENFPSIDATVVDSDIRTALPEKTFLEKAFLLHELFATDRCQIADRKSRHLYDLEKMMDKDFAVKAIHDDQLWQSINHHREKYSSLRGIDYSVDIRKNIILTPPDSVMTAWEKDYNYMRTQMIYSGSALPFDQLIERMRLLQKWFRNC